MTCAKGFQSHVICNCERQAGDPIPQIAMDKLIAKTIKAGVITEHWIIDYPIIIEADHKDTTEPNRESSNGN